MKNVDISQLSLLDADELHDFFEDTSSNAQNKYYPVNITNFEKQ